MTFDELQEKINELELTKIEGFEGFEAIENKNFNRFFALKSAPQYTMLQFKDSEEFNTNSKVWALALPLKEQLVVIDIGNEEEMCDQFYMLMMMYKKGFGRVEVVDKVI